MQRLIPILAAVLLLCGCGESAIEPVTEGPRLNASLAATWLASGPARQTAFSPDGRQLATSDASGAITLRETGTWKVLATMTHPGGATSLAFAIDGTRLFSAGYDAKVREWDVRSHRQLRTFTGARGTVWTLDMSPDGKQLAAAGEDAVIRIWDVDGKAPPAELRGHTRNVWEVRFSPDGRQLASGSFDNSVRLWDPATGRAVRTLSGHEQAVVGLDYSPDGTLLATGSDDSTLRLWRAADGAPVRSVDNGKHVDKVAFSPDGQWIASGGHAHGTLGGLWHELTGGGGDGDSVRLWRTTDTALVAALPHPEDVIWLSFSHDGRWLVTSGEDNRFRLWRLGPQDR